MDNLALARVFGEIADLLEIKSENPFKIRAYRNAADTIAHLAEPLAALSEKDRLGVPGIGKDLAGKLASSIETGSCRYHQELLRGVPADDPRSAPPSGRRPQDRGPALPRARNPDARRSRACRRGRPHPWLKGMGAKKEALILKALEERQRFAGRRLMAEAHDTAAALVAELREHAPDADISTVGSLRRGCETCGDLDILAAGAPASLMDAFTGYRLVERVLAPRRNQIERAAAGEGSRPTSGWLPRESLGACQQYFTGSKAHNIALRDRAIQRGLKLNEYGLFRVEDDARIAGETEEGIYQALGLALVPPELRENRGEIDAAEAGTLPRLVQLAGPPRRPAHAHDRHRRPRRHRDDGARRAGRGARLHRDHRSQPGARDGQWPRRDARARARARRSAS